MERQSNYRLLFIFFALLFSIVAAASPQGTTYQARIIKPDGLPLESANVNFKFTVLDPAAACILYAETFSAISMTNSSGLISFTLGSGLKTYPASATSFAQVFSNSTPALSCDVGGPPSYSPLATDVRKIVMQFNDGGGWQTLPAMAINAVPYAIYAGDSLRLGGVSATNFVQTTTIPTCTVSQAIRYDGSSFSCVTLASGGGASGTITSGDVTTALGYTPANTATVGTSFSTVTSTLNSLGSSVTTFSTSIGALSTSMTALTAMVNGITSSQWTTSGAAIFYDSGNVGIGTSSPSARLHVAGTGQIVTSIESTSDTNGSILRLLRSRTTGALINDDYTGGVKFQGMTSAGAFAVTGAIESFVDSTPTVNKNPGRLVFSTTNPAGTTLERMRISSSGTVGINTFLPVTMLDVSGGVRIGMESSSCVTALAGTLRYTSGNVEYCNGTTWNAFGTSGAVTSSSIIAALSYTPANSATVTSTFNTTNSNISMVSSTVNTLAGTVSSVSSSVTSLTASMAAITSSQWLTTGANISYNSGNVGIGTSNPATRLEIANGNAILNGNFDAYSISAYNNDWGYPVSATIGLGKSILASNSWGETMEFRYTSPDPYTLPPTYVFKGSSTTTDVVLEDGRVRARQVYLEDHLFLTRANANNAAIYTILPATNFSAYDFMQVYSGAGASFGIGAVSAAGAVTGYNVAVGSGTFSIKTSSIERLKVTNAGDVIVPGNVILGSIPNYVNGGSGLYLSNEGTGDAKNFFRIDAYDNDLALVGSSLAGASQGTTLSFATTQAGGGINAALRMRIAANGNVGIGTTNPTALLHVAAGTSSTAPLKLTSGPLLTAAQNGAIEYDGTNIYFTDNTSIRRTLAAATTSGTYSGVTEINSASNITMVPTGSVVVSSTIASTNSQTGALIVKGGLGVAGNINASGTIITTANMQGSTIIASTGMITPLLAGSTAASGNLTLNSTTDATKGNIFLQPQDGGYVAIGAVTPLVGLHVQKPGPLNLAALFQAGVNTGSVAVGTNATYPVSGGQIQGLDGPGAAGTLVLNAIGGNVGIGTAAPGYKLTTETSTTGNVFIADFKQGDGLGVLLGSMSGTSVIAARGTNHDLQIKTYGTGKVWLPNGKLEVSGSIRISDDQTACSSANPGAMRFNPSANAFEMCDGFSWNGVAASDLIPAGSVVLMKTCPTGWTNTGSVDAGPGNANCNGTACQKCQAPNASLVPANSTLLMESCPTGWTNYGGGTTGGPAAAAYMVGDQTVLHFTSCQSPAMSSAMPKGSRLVMATCPATWTTLGDTLGGPTLVGCSGSSCKVCEVPNGTNNSRVLFGGNASGTTLNGSEIVIQGGKGGTTSGLGGAVYVQAGQAASGAYADVSLQGSGGNVGIGNTTPQAKLDIAGGGGSVMRVIASANATATPSVDQDFLTRFMPQNATTEGGHIELKGASTFSDWTMDTTSGDLRFFEPILSRSADKTRGGIIFMVNSSLTSVPTSIDALKITANGNVGIGTVTPTTPLQVANSSTNTSAVATLETTGAGGRPYLKFRAEGSDIGYVGYGSTGQPNLILMNYVSGPTYLGTSSTIRMTITASGAVGVGTQTPQQPLDVNGNAIVNYLHVRATDATEGGEVQLLGGGANGNIQLDNFSGNFRIHTLAPGKKMHLLGGTLSIEGTGGKNYFASNVGIGNTNPLAELDITGDGRATGTFATWSDARAKKNIKVIPDSLNKILRLRGVGFDWRTDEFPEKKFKTTPDIGVIAQEVEQVFPEVVKTASDGYKSVGYAQLVAPLIEAVKELYYKITGVERKIDRTVAEVDALKAENAELKSRLERLEKMMLNQQKSK